MEAYNIEFNRLNILRVKEEAGKPDINLRALRKESALQFKELSKHIEAHALINPTDAFQNLIKEINELVDKYN